MSTEERPGRVLRKGGGSRFRLNACRGDLWVPTDFIASGALLRRELQAFNPLLVPSHPLLADLFHSLGA